MAVRHSAAQKLSDLDMVPNKVSAVLDHYSRGDMGLGEGIEAIKLQQHISDRKEESLEEIFEAVEDELEAEVGEPVDFSYDTKLTFPAELALGEIYDEALDQLSANYSVTERSIETGITDRITKTVPDDKHRRRKREGTEERHQDVLDDISKAEEFTDLVIGLLVEGDMRDAIKDEEYEDFETDTPLGGYRIAEVAQETLFNELQPQLDQYPEGVRDAYEKAVDLGMGHQDEDEDFRRMFEEARENPEEAEEIVDPYRNGETDSRFSLDWSDTDLPFFASQYERVGVLYDGMFEMYEEAEIELDSDFKRSIVFSTIGAQIWLDDVDDLEEDWRNGQLTPVTAELLTSETGEQAYRNIVSMKDEYLDAAREYAARSDSDLASIGIEYIDRRGEDLELMDQIEKIR